MTTGSGDSLITISFMNMVHVLGTTTGNAK